MRRGTAAGWDKGGPGLLFVSSCLVQKGLRPRLLGEEPPQLAFIDFIETTPFGAVLEESARLLLPHHHGSVTSFIDRAEQVCRKLSQASHRAPCV